MSGVRVIDRVRALVVVDADPNAATGVWVREDVIDRTVRASLMGRGWVERSPEYPDHIRVTAAGRAAKACAHCRQREAACVGRRVETGYTDTPACDDCCGHGGEGGNCESIAEDAS